MKTNQTYIARILTWVADLIAHKKDKDYFFKPLVIQSRRFTLDNNYNPGPTPAEFGDNVYRLADEVWPHAIQLTENDLLTRWRL